MVFFGGAWEDFVLSYIKTNLAHARDATAGDRLANGIRLLWNSPVSSLLLGSVSILTVAAIFKLKSISLRRLIFSRYGLLCVYFSAMVLVVIAPIGKADHYYIFILLPSTFVAAAMLNLARDSYSDGIGRVTLGVLGFFMLTPSLAELKSAFSALSSFTTSIEAGASSKTLQRIVSDHLKALAPEAKSMFVWGWLPGLYIDSKFAPATRHSISHFLLSDYPCGPRMRETCLEDLEKYRPDIIVDGMAEGLWFWKNSSYRINLYDDKISKFVRESYILKFELNISGTANPIRVYIRK